MPKGGSSRFRSGGNGRLGVRDCPVELRQILEAYIETPSLLDGLPPAARAEREQQIAALQATRAMRSEASRRGHETRAARRKVPAWELAEEHATAAIEEATTEARAAVAHSPDWDFDEFFEEAIVARAWEVSLVLCEAAVATGHVSAEFAEDTANRRAALDHRYDPEPESASADGGADAEAEPREAKP